MPGIYRQRIGPTKLLLKLTLDDLPDQLIALPPNTPDDQRLQTIRDNRNSYDRYRSLLVNRVASLRKLDHDYVQKIESLGNSDNADAESSSYHDYATNDEGHLTLIDRADTACAELTTAINEADQLIARLTLNAPLPQFANAPAPQPARPPMLDIKLPTLQIEPFDGTPEKWPAFNEMFTNHVHNNPQYTTTSKFTYLMSLMTQEAQTAMAGFSIASRSYEEALAFLRSEFGDQQKILRSLYNKLRNLTPVTQSQTMTKDLRHFLYQIDNTLRQLRAYGQDVDSEANRHFLILTMQEKIPKVIMGKLNQNKQNVPGQAYNEEWKVATFCIALRGVVNEIESLDEIYGQKAPKPATAQQQSSTQGRPSHPHRQQTPQAGRFSNAFTATTTPTKDQRVQQFNKQPPSPCAFCSNSHFSDQCMSFPTSYSRATFCRQHRICLRCLRTGHITSKCNSTRLCYHCKKNGHHSALCNQKFGDTARPTEQASTNKPEALFGTTRRNNIPVITMAVNQQSCQAKSRLMTSTTTLLHPTNSGRQRQLRILYDSGSTDSFLAAEVATALDLPVLHTTEINIQTFGGHTKKVWSHLVSFSLLTKENELLTISAYTMPADSLATAGQYDLSAEDSMVLANYPTAELAEPFLDTEEQCHLLLGADQFFRVIKLGQHRILSSGIALVPSLFGIIIAGADVAKFEATDNQTRSSTRAVHMICTTQQQSDNAVKFAGTINHDNPTTHDRDEHAQMCMTYSQPLSTTHVPPLSPTHAVTPHQTTENPVMNVQTTVPAIRPPQAPPTAAVSEQHTPINNTWVNASTTHESKSPPTETKVTHGQTSPKEGTDEMDTNIKRQFDLDQIEQFWQLENICVKTNKQIKEEEHQLAMESFESTFRLEDNHITVGWPWSPNCPDTLPDHFGIALSRLKSLYRKLDREPELKAAYVDIFQKQLDTGILEDIPINTPASPRTHIIPHHAVVNPEKGKVRPVLDASCRLNPESPSLNDCVLPGIVEPPEIPKMIFYFRTRKYIVTADIQQAFLTLTLREEDRDSVRVLWLKDASKPPEKDNIRILRFRKICFGIRCSPFLLEQSLKKALKMEGSTCARDIADNCYVDNICIGFSDPDKLLPFYEQSKTIFRQLSMNLREFNSNHTTFLDHLPQEDKLPKGKTKVLGVTWTPEKDIITFSPLKPVSPGPTTKRNIQSDIASVFDPTGMLGPLIVPAKLLLRTVHQRKEDWDTPILDDTLNERWLDIRKHLENVDQLTVPRYIPIETRYELHIFADSSKDAFSAAAYIRIPVATSKYRTYLLMSKNALAPCQTTITIPRLELLAIGLAVRMQTYITDSEKLPGQPERTYIHSDSQIALAWIRSEKFSLGRFVDNRLRAIRSSSATFCYVRSENNPADFATRCLTTSEMCNPNHIWWTGAKYLATDDWPDEKFEQITPEILKEAAKAKTTKVTPIQLHINAVAVQKAKADPELEIADPTRFSSLTRLLNTVTYVLRFIKKCKYQPAVENNPTIYQMYQDKILAPTEIITAEEREIAQLLTESVQQKQYYGPELRTLSDKKVPATLRGLVPRLDQHNIIRCDARMAHAALPELIRSPILLPKDTPYTTLVIMDNHIRKQHAGIQHTLTAVQQRNWCPQGRAQTRKTLHRCVTCKRNNGGSYKLPSMDPLPEERVQMATPFSECGCDYFGPINTKDGTECAKRWICLFTCLTTRAIHLEVVMDCSAYHALNALRTFIARRGKPRRIRSDNGSQFVLLAKLLQTTRADSQPDSSVLEYCAREKIIWTFIRPLSPWSGGIWERMVGVTKKSMKAAIGQRLLTTEQLRVITCETEAVVNSRPICPVTSEPGEIVIRPCDFLTPLQHTNIAVENDDDPADPTYQAEESSQRTLSKLWQKEQAVLNKFWEHWLHNYLPTLRQSTQTEHPHPRITAELTPACGDMVLMHQENQPRGTWPVGRLINLLPTQNGKPKAAVVQTTNGKQLTRPLNLLYPFETTTRHLNPQLPTKPANDDLHLATPPNTPPRRSQRILGLNPAIITLLALSCLLAPVNAQYLLHEQHKSPPLSSPRTEKNCQLTETWARALSICSNATECADQQTFNFSNNPYEELCIQSPGEQKQYSFILEKATINCEKYVQYHTRSFKTNVIASYYCAEDEPCQNATTNSSVCTNMPIDRHISQFFESADFPADYPSYPPEYIPGASHCYLVHGNPKWNCTPSTADNPNTCIFYRKYPIFTSHKIYTVFTCKQWTTKLDILLKTTENSPPPRRFITTTSEALTVFAGKAFYWNGLTLQIDVQYPINITQAQTPGTLFITDSKTISMQHTSNNTINISQKLDHITCATRYAAATMKCKFDDSACACQQNAHLSLPECDCHDVTIDDMFSSKTSKQSHELFSEPRETKSHLYSTVTITAAELTLKTEMDTNEQTNFIITNITAVTAPDPEAFSWVLTQLPQANTAFIITAAIILTITTFMTTYVCYKIAHPPSITPRARQRTTQQVTRDTYIFEPSYENITEYPDLELHTFPTVTQQRLLPITALDSDSSTGYPSSSEQEPFVHSYNSNNTWLPSTMHKAVSVPNMRILMLIITVMHATATATNEQCEIYVQHRSNENYYSQTSLEIAEPTCFTMETAADQPSEPPATLHISISYVILDCLKNTSYYTRDMGMKSTFAYICPGHEFCATYQNCSQNMPKPEELQQIYANNTQQTTTNLVIDHCFSAVVGYKCSKYGKGCLFYRHFADPKTTQVYKITECHNTQPKTMVTLKWQTQNKTEVTQKKTTSGVPLYFNQLQLTINVEPRWGPTTDTITFISHPEHIAPLTEAESEPIITCNSAENAAKLDCKLRDSACTCQTNPVKSNPRCQCRSIKWDRPLNQNGYTINNGSEIVTTNTDDFKIILLIEHETTTTAKPQKQQRHQTTITITAVLGMVMIILIIAASKVRKTMSNNRNNYTQGVLLITLLTARATALHRNHSRCKNDTHPSTHNQTTKILEAEQCVSTGYVIRELDTGLLCWDLRECPPQQHLQADGTCSYMCTCPTPGMLCTHTAVKPAMPSHEDIQLALGRSRPTFCSINQTPECQANPTYVSLPVIRLANSDTFTYVKNLHITVEETISVDNFHCTGLTHGKRRTGTPEFCDRHSCHDEGDILCWYGHTEQPYYLDPTNMRIPVLEYGYKNNVPIYMERAATPYNTDICIQCKVNCVTGGVHIITANGTNYIELCSKPICYTTSFPTEEVTLLLTPEVTMGEHIIEIKIWKDGIQIYKEEKTCPPTPFCENIQCYNCIERIQNPHCTPRLALIAFFIILYWSTILLYLLTKVTYFTMRSLGYTWKCMRCCGRVCSKVTRKASNIIRHRMTPVYTLIKDDETDEGDLTTPPSHSLIAHHKNTARHKTRFTTSILAVLILLTTSHITMVTACADATTLTADQHRCTANQDGNLTCVLDQITEIHTYPAGQATCLMIQTQDGKPLGVIKFEINQIRLLCQQHTEFYTREYEMQTTSVTRCPGQGSCRNNQCRDLKPDEIVEELAGTESTGTSFCADGPSCWMHGCFSCIQSCIFYRTHATETGNQDVFKIYSCPAWNYIISATVTIITSSETMTQQMDIFPGIPTNYQNIRISINQITAPPLPLLGKRFMTDEKRTALIDSSSSGSPQAGTVGSLQCAVREDAEKFSCFISKNTCKCDIRSGSAVCTCDEISLQKIFENPEAVLPLQTPSVFLIPSKQHGVEAILDSHLAFSATINMKGANLITKIENNKCAVDVLTIIGCTGCMVGVKMKIKCKSDSSHTVAHVTCSPHNTRFVLQCTPAGLTNDVTIHSNTAKLTASCTATCTAGQTTFDLNAELAVIKKQQLGQVVNRYNAKEVDNSMDFSFMEDLVSANFLSNILIGALTCAAAIGTIILLPYLIPAVLPMIQVVLNVTKRVIKSYCRKCRLRQD